MKRENTSIRLKKIMSEKNLRQVDILECVKPYCKKYDVKMNKSDLSQYVSGKVEPNQDKLYILALALNVSEAWLMGFDVPIERSVSNKESSPKIIQYYEKLNDIGKNEATKRVEELTYIQKYTDNIPEDLHSQGQRSETEEKIFNNKVIPMMSEDNPRYVNAAHAIEGASEEDIQFDENIMDDENF